MTNEETIEELNTLLSRYEKLFLKQNGIIKNQFEFMKVLEEKITLLQMEKQLK